MKTKTASAVRITAVAPLFNRCIRFATSGGGIDVKVMGDDIAAPAARKALVDALAKAGLKVVEPPKPAKEAR